MASDKHRTLVLVGLVVSMMGCAEAQPVVSELPDLPNTELQDNDVFEEGPNDVVDLVPDEDTTGDLTEADEDELACPEPCPLGAKLCVNETDYVLCLVRDNCAVLSTEPQSCASGERCANGICLEGSPCTTHDDFGEPCSAGLGACERQGSFDCALGAERPVCNAVAGLPSAMEICDDSIDNDCNGFTDAADVACRELPPACEEHIDFGKVCSVGVGACMRNGSKQCPLGQSEPACNAVAGSPSPEQCSDGIDNDCDGFTDAADSDCVMGCEQHPSYGTACTTGIGACSRSGNFHCPMGASLPVCNAVAGQPSIEHCSDGIDNDCDGKVDGADPDCACTLHSLFGTSCSAGIGACLRTGSHQCAPGASTPVCSATPGTPTVELCSDGIDNDCDGFTDGADSECQPPPCHLHSSFGQSCSAGVGACASTGQNTCPVGASSPVCNAVAGTPAPYEYCDSPDHDCNGNNRTNTSGTNVCTTCVEDGLEPNNGSSTATSLPASTTLRAVSCGAWSNPADRDWYALGNHSTSSPAQVQLNAYTATNLVGAAYASMRADVYCKLMFCASFSANTGTVSMALATTSCSCATGDALHLTVFPSTSTPNPASGTPYTLQRF